MPFTTGIPIGRFVVLANPELFERVPRLERGNQPARLFTTSRPSLCRAEWIEVFWHDFRVFAARRLTRSGAGGPAFSFTELIRLVELRKTFFELSLLDCDLFGKYLC